MLKLAIEDCGTQLALYLTGDNKQEIVERFYSLWNHGATSGELHWVFEEPMRGQNAMPDGELRAYIWTTPERLEKAVLNAMLFKLLNEAEESNCFKGCKGGAMPYAKAQARDFIDSIEHVKKLVALCGGNRGFRAWFDLCGKFRRPKYSHRLEHLSPFHA